MIVERPLLERRVLTSLDAGRIPVLLGGCGSGRTSFLFRLHHVLGVESSQYLDMAAAATTPERCLVSVRAATKLALPPPVDPVSTRVAADALFEHFDAVRAAHGPATWLLDEFLEFRTFENFPGLRQIVRELVARLAASPARFVLASRFTARVHRLLRDAPARFEVVHMPPLEVADVQDMAQFVAGPRREWAAGVAPAVTSLSGGQPSAAHALLQVLATMGSAWDPVAAMAAAFAPEGVLTARSRACYELRLMSARGYGALKAILGILAENEPLNLTEIAAALRRTPGSTKDYLSWLEDVDLVTVRGKRYVITEPLLRLYIRLYGRPGPPTDDDIVREVSAFARTRLPLSPSSSSPSTPAPSAVDHALEPAIDQRSGIIEID